MRKMRIAQVGCGGRGLGHLESIERAPNVELVALCEMDSVKLHAAGARFGVPNLYSDMTTMIRETQADLISIITPPTLRLAVVKPAIAAGARAILLEKPLALTPSEARELAGLGRETFIAINTQYGWMPHWSAFWPRLESGVLGEIREIRASTRCNILEQGPHIIALALEAARIGDLPAPQWALAAGSGLEFFGETPVPADTTALIGLGDARLHLDCGLAAPRVVGEEKYFLEIQVEIIGSKGRFHASLTQGWHLETDHGIENGPTGWPVGDNDAQPAFFEALREAILGQTTAQFPTRVEVANQQTQLLFACYASIAERKRIELPRDFDDSVVKNLQVLA